MAEAGTDTCRPKLVAVQEIEMTNDHKTPPTEDRKIDLIQGRRPGSIIDPKKTGENLTPQEWAEEHADMAEPDYE